MRAISFKDELAAVDDISFVEKVARVLKYSHTFMQEHVLLFSKPKTAEVV